MVVPMVYPVVMKPRFLLILVYCRNSVINLPASQFGIRSFFDEEQEKEKRDSSSAPQRSVVKDSYEEERTYIDSSSLFLCAENGEDEDINVYHDDPPADFGPMVEEE